MGMLSPFYFACDVSECSLRGVIYCRDRLRQAEAGRDRLRQAEAG